MRKFYFLFFCLCIASFSYSQCKSSIQLKKAVNETGLKNGGVIEVLITSTDQHVCVLSIEKGTGPQYIQEKKGMGTNLIRFEGLDVDNVYQIQVEFISDNTHCRKLQKSQIILESE